MKDKFINLLLRAIQNPWRWLANVWGYLTILILLIDFFANDHARLQATGIAIIYTAVLVIYIGKKEYLRWRKNNFISQYNGEFFIALWTLLLFVFVTMSGFYPDRYTIDPAFYTTYITVLGLFAITLNSKSLKKRKNRK